MYPQADPALLDEHGNHFSRHMSGLTEHNLRSKTDVALQLAVRDAYIQALLPLLEPKDMYWKAIIIRDLGLTKQGEPDVACLESLTQARST